MHSPTDDRAARFSAQPYFLISTILCWLVIGAFVAISVWSQARSARIAAATAVTNSTPNLGLEITGRLAVAQSQTLAKDTSPDAQKRAANLRAQLCTNVLQLAVSPLDKLKAIVTLHELQSVDTAMQSLDADASIFATQPLVAANARMIRVIYTTGPATISATDRISLLNDLGWFGQLALTQGLASNDPARVAVLRSARRSFITAITLLTAMLLILGLGFLLLILLVVLFSLGKLKFNFEPGDSIKPPAFLESFAMWGAAYLFLSLALNRWKTGRSPLLFELLFAAVTVVIAMWPMMRGITWSQLRRSLGWHTGRGVLVEMGAGFLGYIAGLPILAVGILITLVLSKLTHANPTHPIQQELAGPMPISKIVALLITISIAAPLLEETMFRGVLYFHLRRRWRPWFSAGGVALIFAAIHPQGWTAIPVLGSIAVTLAMLREWRGSLLASVTAHGINNGVVLLAVLLMLR